ncbi:MAG: zinc metallopeptidase [Spirochaetales bacterium]
MFSGTYLDYYLMGIILIPGLILAIIAQARVTKAFNKYSQVMSMRGLTGSELARKILDEADLQNVEVVRTEGTLTDNYNPKTKTLSLSDAVYSSSSVASLGVAAHEVGHAIQHKEGYLPAKIRSILVPITNLISHLLWPLVMLGLLFNFGAETGGNVGNIFLWSGVILFGAAVLFSLITLPVEFDASKRAKKLMLETNVIDEMEVDGAKKVLNAAALTYVASLVVAILNLIRFILVARRRN